MSYKYILFDLDGTLTDPALGITNSVMYALKKFGITPPEREQLLPFIGPPLAESFINFYGFSEEMATKAVEYYREYFSQTGIFENSIIKGIPALLNHLRDADKTLILATSKPLVFAEKILEHFDLAKYFSGAFGSNLDGSLSDKAEVINEAISKMKITDKKSAIMVGDRKHDIIGANKNGLKSVGVLFGYGSKAELENAGATHIVSDTDQLLKILL